MREFEVIKHYFANQQHGRGDVIKGSGDDCALLQPPPNQLLASTIDALIEGVHFPKGTDPESLGYKAMAVSLSDLAAMGAEPAWAVATLAMPEVNEAWLDRFAHGLFTALDAHQVALVGGDLVRGPLAMSTQLTGFVPQDKAMLRSGAQEGDCIVVTGTLGDAGMALRLLQSNHAVPELLLERLNRPTPRVSMGLKLRGLAHSAIDISDGLLADLGHLLASSNSASLGATLAIEHLPLSDALRSVSADNLNLAQQLALTAGDDYELCFTMAPDQFEQLRAEHLGVALTKIGTVTREPGIVCTYHGQVVTLPTFGFQHFQ